MLLFMWMGVVSCASRRSYSSPDRTNCRPRVLEGSIACNPAKRLYTLFALRTALPGGALGFLCGEEFAGEIECEPRRCGVLGDLKIASGGFRRQATASPVDQEIASPGARNDTGIIKPVRRPVGRRTGFQFFTPLSPMVCYFSLKKATSVEPSAAVIVTL